MHRLPFTLSAFVLACRMGAEPRSTSSTRDEREEHQAQHWTYAGADGPQHWGDIDNGYAACGAGRFQSPVDLPPFSLFPDPHVSTEYTAGPLDVVDTGHTVQLRTPGQGTLTIAGHEFSLSQIHLHSPSEHAVDGKRFPLEIHMVHEDGAGNFAVIGIFAIEALDGRVDEVWEHLPHRTPAQERFDEVQFNPGDLLPAPTTHYQYAGSLTTPPCTERVTWKVMATPVRLRREQIESFRQLYRGNARPLQARHDWCLAGRDVKERPPG